VYPNKPETSERDQLLGTGRREGGGRRREEGGGGRREEGGGGRREYNCD